MSKQITSVLPFVTLILPIAWVCNLQLGWIFPFLYTNINRIPFLKANKQQNTLVLLMQLLYHGHFPRMPLFTLHLHWCSQLLNGFAFGLSRIQTILHTTCLDIITKTWISSCDCSHKQNLECKPSTVHSNSSITWDYTNSPLLTPSCLSFSVLCYGQSIQNRPGSLLSLRHTMCFFLLVFLFL